MPGKIGKKSDDGDALKRLKEYEKAYANYKGAVKPIKVDAKKQKTLADLIKTKPSPKRPGGR